MTSKTKKRKIFQRLVGNHDDEMPIEDCGKLMEKWKELLQDFCGDSEFGGASSDHLLNNDKFKLLTSTYDPEDDLEQFLESIGAIECRGESSTTATTTPSSNKTGSDTELRNDNCNNKKNDNNNNDCSKSSNMAEEDVENQFPGKLRNRDDDQSREEKEAVKIEGPNSLFKNSVVISKFKMAKLRETLIESEQTIRKLLELKKPRSTWEDICGQEVDNFFAGKPEAMRREKNIFPVGLEQQEQTTAADDDIRQQQHRQEILAFDSSSNSFNSQIKPRDRKSTKFSKPNKTLEPEVFKQSLKRPKDEAKAEILIDGRNFEGNRRNPNLRTRVTSYENFLETEKSNRQRASKSHSKQNFSNGSRNDFNFSNCCNTRNVHSSHSVEVQNDARRRSRNRGHNKQSKDPTIGQPIGEHEAFNFKETPNENPTSDNIWKVIEKQNEVEPKFDDSSSECSECFSSGHFRRGGRIMKAKSRSRTCGEKQVRSIGTTMNTCVHEETSSHSTKKLNWTNNATLSLNCCRYSLQDRKPRGMTNDVSYEGEREQCYYHTNNGRMSTESSSGRHEKRNFTQNYDYCCLCEGQCRESTFAAIAGNRNSPESLEQREENKYWMEKSVQTDEMLSEFPKNYVLCERSDAEDFNYDYNNNQTVFYSPTFQNRAPLENPSAKLSCSPTTPTGMKTFAGQTDIIDLIDEITSEDMTDQQPLNNQKHPSQKCRNHTTTTTTMTTAAATTTGTASTTGQQHQSPLQESNPCYPDSDKKPYGSRKQTSRNDEVYNSSQRIVRAIDDELQGMKPFVSKVDRATKTRLANTKEINKISDFLSTSNINNY